MNLFDLTLYLVTDSGGLDEAAFLAKLEGAIRGGVTLLQLREKTMEGRDFFRLALRVRELSGRYGVPLIIDDRADIALAAHADGVHVGQSDLPVEAARRLLGPDKIVGATAKTVEQALEAERQGADYLGVGAIFPTSTKVKTVLTSAETLSAIRGAVTIPIVAIGGLTVENMDVLAGSGVSGVAVVSAIMKSGNPEEAARRLKDTFTALAAAYK